VSAALATTCGRERIPTIVESAIRARFVRDSFHSLSTGLPTGLSRSSRGALEHIKCSGGCKNGPDPLGWRAAPMSSNLASTPVVSDAAANPSLVPGGPSRWGDECRAPCQRDRVEPSLIFMPDRDIDATDAVACSLPSHAAADKSCARAALAAVPYGADRHATTAQGRPTMRGHRGCRDQSNCNHLSAAWRALPQWAFAEHRGSRYRPPARCARPDGAARTDGTTLNALESFAAPAAG
jgi:hypothetical protein